MTHNKNIRIIILIHNIVLQRISLRHISLLWLLPKQIRKITKNSMKNIILNAIIAIIFMHTPCYREQIFCSRLLSWNWAAKSHIKIFLPPNKSVISPPESNNKTSIANTISQIKSNCSKLLFTRIINLRLVKTLKNLADSHSPISRTSCNSEKKTLSKIINFS
ncbi:Uncharacterised protein [Chlamydia trachomatis]|nr:Uncharacterised protein [Chlamydia trachomatis]